MLHSMKHALLSVIALACLPTASAEDIHVEAHKYSPLTKSRHFFSFFIAKKYLLSESYFQKFLIFQTNYFKNNDNSRTYIEGNNREILPIEHEENIIPLISEEFMRSNPNIISNMTKGNCLYSDLHFQLKDHPSHFTLHDAQVWDYNFNHGIKDIVGFVLYQMMPILHRSVLTIPPHAQFLHDTSTGTHLVVDNQSEQPYPYIFDTRLYGPDDQFHLNNGTLSIEIGDQQGHSLQQNYCR